MQFGVTFYPDQWPRDYWDKAFAQIKLTGFEVVRFGEMMWDWVEPREGHFDFKNLDHALGLCKKHGLKVILGTGTAQAPQWLIHKHPQVRPVAHDGTLHPEYGPRPNACRDNAVYHKLAKRLVDKLARRYANHPALFMWQLDNEPSYPPLDLTENKDWCHCEATRKAFKEWAEKKYLKLETLNQAWGTKFWVETYSNFKEIKTPKAGFWDAGNPHIYLDWYRFKSERLASWLQELKQVIRRRDKFHKVGTNGFTTIPNRSVDHTVLAQNLDWFGWDIYPKGTQNSDESLAQLADYWNGVCQKAKAEFWVMELQAGPNVRWGCPDKVNGEDIKRWTRLLIEHGAKGIMYFNWRPPLVGSETGGFGLLNADGSSTERLEAVREIIQEYKKKSLSNEGGKSIPPLHWKENQIAIGYLRSSEIQTFQEEGFSRPCPPAWFSGRGEIGMFYQANSIAGAYKIAQIEGGVEFIFEKQLETGDIKAPVLLLPNPYLISPKQNDILRDWVEDGGALVTECRYGQKNEMGHLYPRPLIENLVKFSSLTTEIISNPVTIPKLKAAATGFRERIKLAKGAGQILATFADKEPALLKFKAGRGKVIYATFSLFSSLLNWQNGKLRQLVRKELEK